MFLDEANEPYSYDDLVKIDRYIDVTEGDIEMIKKELSYFHIKDKKKKLEEELRIVERELKVVERERGGSYYCNIQ